MGVGLVCPFVVGAVAGGGVGFAVPCCCVLAAPGAVAAVAVRLPVLSVVTASVTERADASKAPAVRGCFMGTPFLVGDVQPIRLMRRGYGADTFGYLW